MSIENPCVVYIVELSDSIASFFVYDSALSWALCTYSLIAHNRPIQTLQKRERLEIRQDPHRIDHKSLKTSLKKKK